jgi:putative PIN family toxin of toxin-antitoxin system
VRVVLDTNILVSALVFPGRQSEKALLRIVRGGDQLLISKPLINELLDVLARKFARDPEALARVAIFLAQLGELVSPRSKVSVLRDDPDNRVLECAAAGGADVIVTGDRAMLALGTFGDTRIVSLREHLGS